MKTLCILLLSSTVCSAAMIQFHWTPSPSDTNGAGQYVFSTIQGGLSVVTNTPAGQTNAWINLSGPCCVTCQFATATATSTWCNVVYIDQSYFAVAPAVGLTATKQP